MNKEIETITETRKKVLFTFEVEDVAKEEKKVLSSFTAKASIPGFRKGKAPVAMLRKKYAKDITQELERVVTSKAYEQLQQDKSLNLYRLLDLKIEKVSPLEGAEISLEVDVVPEFELPNFSEFSYEKSESEPTDEELEQAIEHLRTQRADFQVVERAAEKGDYVQCSYTGKIGDELVSDRVADKPIYGSQETSWEEAGSEDGRISAISEAIVGMKSGDSKEVSMNYPSDFEVEALQEMEVLYSLEVSEIRAKVLPELNDEFFKSLEVESLEALKIKTREQMKSQRDYSNKMQIRKKVSEDFTASVDFELPLSGIEDQRDAHLHETMERRMSQGASQEDLEEQKETLIAESTEVAKDRLKLTLMLDKVAFSNKVQAEKEDFNNAIMQEAYMNQTEPNKLIKELSKDRDRVEQLRGDIIRSKALDLIIEQATVIEAAQPEAVEA